VRILVIEDEPAILDFIARGLVAEGFVVECAADGLEGQRRALENGFDLIVLDLMLPGKPGLEVLSAIRAERPELPVILLTARAEIEDRVAGLDAGATDYLVKPFAFAELTARVRAHLRVAGRTQTTMLRVGDIELDLISRQVRRGGELVQLTAKEFDLLAHFLRHPDQVLTREELLRGVWGYDFHPGTNVVEVYVGYLRRKLRREGMRDPIVTVRSVGYRLRSDDAGRPDASVAGVSPGPGARAHRDAGPHAAGV
jgi:two-component system, OmpR family, response regulator